MTITQENTATLVNIGAEERDHLWRSAVRDRMATIDMRPTGRFPRRGSAEKHDLGDLMITDWNCPDLEGRRTSRMASNDPDALLLFTVFTGQQLIETPRDSVVLRPGNLLVLSSRTTGRFVVPHSMQKRTVRIPLNALAPFDTGQGIPECLFLDTENNALAGLANDYLIGVSQKIEHMTHAELEGARNGLLALVAGMIRATQVSDITETDFLPLLRRQLESWIVDHLTSGAIRVRDLAAAHNVAPRTVHRAFASTADTVGSIVRSHRIAAARSDLVNTTSSIAAIAHRWGFCDASHLGREFRREFSMSPSDYRQAYAIA